MDERIQKYEEKMKKTLGPVSIVIVSYYPKNYYL